MAPGIYTLVLLLDRAQEIEVGSLGIVQFVEGYYSYTGSARGPGGLKRVERHKRVLLGASSVRRWHIDYLLPYTSLVDAVVTRTFADLECRIAGRIGSELRVVPHFGSTDCRCPGHLHFSQELDQIQDVVCRAHQEP
ncbi:MAG: GIY-YIG nuclease family protein [Methanotrichaceae archaeon]|jgi:Uri superfamily endonuclease